MSIRHKRLFLLIALLEVGLLALAFRPRADPGEEPALLAQRIQQQLFAAQQSLASDPAGARPDLEAVRPLHATLIGRLPSSAYGAAQAANDALAQAESALAANDALALVQARADYQTALLWAGYLAALEAARAGRGADAAIWLKLRAFKPSSRVDPAASNATLAVQDLAGGRIPGARAAAIISNELNETYQALMVDAVESSVTAAFRKFDMRAAEAATLAAGYYRILRAGFVARVGAERANSADRAFVDLRAACAASDWPSVQRARNAIVGALGE